MSKNWEQRERKVEKRRRGMKMSGKGTVRQENERREKARRQRDTSEDNT